MTVAGLKLTAKQLLRGEFQALILDGWIRLYKQFYGLVFWFHRRQRQTASRPDPIVQVESDHPVAFDSPDHLIPWGTKQDNSTNKKFVLSMDALIAPPAGDRPKSFMDLGCSGGGLVKDFRDLDWLAVGLEGSDFSLKHQRACWKKLAGKSLFTCDITKPFRVLVNGQPNKFLLITAWEVLEHINQKDLPVLFDNILAHMEKMGCFIASTTSTPDIHNGVDLHQTHWTNAQWRSWIAQNVPELKPVELGLRFYQYVRSDDRSFLTYRRE